jgi:hypothetical protein
MFKNRRWYSAYPLYVVFHLWLTTQKVSDTMIALGLRKNFKDAGQLETFEVRNRPTEMPHFEDDKKVIGGLVDEEGREYLFLCETLGEMQLVYDSFANSTSQELLWYSFPSHLYVAGLLFEEGQQN